MPKESELTPWLQHVEEEEEMKLVADLPQQQQMLPDTTTTETQNTTRGNSQFKHQPFYYTAAAALATTENTSAHMDHNYEPSSSYQQYQEMDHHDITFHQKQIGQDRQFIDDDEILDYRVKDYIRQRKKRKEKFNMCCVCFPKCVKSRNAISCDPRIGMVDLSNENVFFRFVVWALFARLYFEAIYLTKVFLIFSDERMDAIILKCDFREMLFGGFSTFKAVYTVLALSGMFWSVSFLNSVTSLNFKKRLPALIFIAIAVAIDVSLNAWSISCYKTNLFDIVPNVKPYPFLSPGETQFRLMNASAILASQSQFFQFLNESARTMKHNIQTSQFNFVEAYLVVEWILAFLLIFLLAVPFIAAIVHHATGRKHLQYFSFYELRLKRFYGYVRNLFSNTKRQRNRKHFFSESGSYSSSLTATHSSLSTSLEVDDIENEINEKIEAYWRESDKKLIVKFFVVYWMKIRYSLSALRIRIKKKLQSMKGGFSSFFFPSRLIIGLSSSVLIVILILTTFAALSLHVGYSAFNILFIISVLLFCFPQIIDFEKFDTCQTGVSSALMRVVDLIEVNFFIAEILTFIVIVVIIILILRNYKRHIQSYRKGKLPFNLSSYSIINASNYPGLQSAHFALATVVYFAIIYIVLIIIGLIIFMLSVLGQAIGPMIEAFFKSFFVVENLPLILNIFTFLGTKITTVVLAIILKLVFLRKKGTWLIHNALFSVFDVLFITVNYVFGFIVAGIISTLKTVIFALLNYVRMDQPHNPGFNSYAGLLKLDAHHSDPIINVFIDMLKKKARKKELLIEHKIRENPNITMDQLTQETTSVNKTPKLKNYLKLIALLSKNHQLAHERKSMTSEYFDEEEYEKKRHKYLNSYLNNTSK
ncbi:hypothetical protein C9374_001127 [Naegleria lovaniensis]|uniref:Uncharacterized protein n=1 Tax=Naegleria lovaniensis TaxID=51637 RepID=A0AA88KMG1_NAELO|nr:uncharacterized protein C9374_001127 [Naegleria lovaniensis]KAG2387533.1 hypothetical protein C9374_001127 [Naegleria lovaniensis]